MDHELLFFNCSNLRLFLILFVIGGASLAIADEDALSVPTADTTPHIAIPKPPSKPNNTIRAKKVTKANKKKNKTTRIPKESTQDSHNFTATPIATSTAAITLNKNVTLLPNPTPRSTLTDKEKKNLPRVTIIPNPAYGDRVIFRVMANGPAKAHIVVYDRFFNKMDQLEGEGDNLFDIIWSLKKIPEGIYYFQTLIDNKTDGSSQKIAPQNFAVEKDEEPKEPGN